jgi:ATP-dependent DNA helicase RecQ
MVDYFHTKDCRMRFIANLLDDPSTDPCGICDNCTGESSERKLPVRLVAEAERFLANRPIVLNTKKLAFDVETNSRRRIPDKERIEQGRVLSIWGDAGWGRLVREGKQDTGSFDDRLVDALVEMVTEWTPNPPPTWVTCVPSTRHPQLVPLFAEQVAKRLGLPFIPAVTRLIDRPPQKQQHNAAHQQRNVEGAFGTKGSLNDGPVLLIDDVVDSSWTMTEIGRVLRRAGVSQVYPVALASSAGRE